MKSILDCSFRYTSSAQTDLRKTFAKIRRQQSPQKRALEETRNAHVANQSDEHLGKARSVQRSRPEG
jgi:hypothetical protein